MPHTYYAEISRDNEAGVWYVSDTDFPGLVAEAPSLTRAGTLRNEPASLRSVVAGNDPTAHNIKKAGDDPAGGLMASVTSTLKR